SRLREPAPWVFWLPKPPTSPPTHTTPVLPISGFQGLTPTPPILRSGHSGTSTRPSISVQPGAEPTAVCPMFRCSRFWLTPPTTAEVAAGAPAVTASSPEPTLAFSTVPTAEQHGNPSTKA